ncbi:anti-sigma regulatory factor [Ectothiorhodospira shaposhnikovii]|uniref:anti-sigma regulatory factor n=1 Tax=Ectothiorhodospira shaposhnikovii TaxID=1054 RepID=UPI001908B467|nr:anti-sigma regulatory factor [Ectothiorhodospira shaposhnikovii]MBK1673883.1 anti-sigma regulatory factor [Ectothiorhodospira shaposhnikovii]
MTEPRPPARFAIGNSSDIVTARQAARALSAHLGFGKAHQTRLATAVSELTRNVIQYAGEGSCLIEDLSDDQERVIRISIEDHGPGIPNLPLAMEDGFSTSGGLGAGLPGARRLVDDFHVSSAPGLTRVVIAIRKPA